MRRNLKRLLLGSTVAGLAGATLFCDFVRDRYYLNGTVYNSFLAVPGASYSGGASGGSYVPWADGSVKLAAQNTPRRSDLGLLSEEARTNLLLQSTDLTSATWAANAGLLSRTSGFLAPDNSTTAVKIVPDTTTGQHRLGQTITATAAAHTAIIHAKAAGYNWLVVNMYDGTSANLASFNLATGAIGTLGAGNTATMVPAANGFYRITVTRTMLASASAQALFLPSSADNTISMTGDGVSGTILWQADLQAGSTATSSIPTTTVAVTRAADVAQVTGLTAVAATLYFEGTPNDDPSSGATNRSLASLNDTTGNNRVSAFRGGSATPGVNFRNIVAGVSTSPNNVAFSGVSLLKTAIAASASRSMGAANSVLASTPGAPAGVAAWTQLQIGLDLANPQFNGFVRRVGVYAVDTDAQLQARTTL